MIVASTLLAGYQQQLESNPSKTAFVLDDCSFSFADLQARVALLQQTFSQRKHLRVAIALPNCVDVACWYIACVTSRHTLILMDHEWPEATRTAALQLVQPDILVSGKEGVVDHYDSQATANPAWFQDDNFAFLAGFTSGSSGQPKAFLRYSDSWLASFKCSTREFDVSSGTVQLAPGPLSHGLSFYTMAESLHLGATFMTQTAFDAGQCINALHSNMNGVNNLVVVPTMLQRVLDAKPHFEDQLQGDEGATDAPLKFRAIVAGAKLSGYLKQRFHNSWPTARLSEYYGASELSFVSVNHDHEQLPHDSVGRLCDGVSIATFDETGKHAEGKNPGTLHVRSPMLAAGYLQQQENEIASAPLTGRDGWFTVGDRGWLDDNRLYLTDREDRMLISGGLNVYPSRVERVIDGAIRDSDIAGNVEHCVICGIPDPEWGELVVLVLAGPGLLQQQKVVTATVGQSLADLAAGTLQKHEVPRRLFVAETVPMTSSGKVAYRELQRVLPGLLEIQL